jgi:hypothetical protein
VALSLTWPGGYLKATNVYPADVSNGSACDLHVQLT